MKAEIRDDLRIHIIPENYTECLAIAMLSQRGPYSPDGEIPIMRHISIHSELEETPKSA